MVVAQKSIISLHATGGGVDVWSTTTVVLLNCVSPNSQLPRAFAPMHVNVYLLSKYIISSDYLFNVME